MPQPPSEPPPPDAVAAAHVARASSLVRHGEHGAAQAACIDALRTGTVPIHEGIRLESILREIGDVGLADQIRAGLLNSVDALIDRHGDAVEAMGEAANILLELGEAERALELVTRARKIDAANPNLLFLHYFSLLRTDAYAADRIDPEPALEASDEPAFLSFGLAKLLATHGRRDEGLAMLARAERWCTSPELRMRRDQVRAALSGRHHDIDQRALAVGLFDSFADHYDQNLAALSNNGPQMIDILLRRLGFPAERRLRVLDAGCGTGLCAPFLRPYARLLHGIDLSIGMLEKCREKGGHDLLTRSDLAAAETFPEGSFDLVVCADVFVYFAALDRVLGNLAAVLERGGVLIFTVEEAQPPLPDAGHGPTPSGRTAHGEPYLREALRAAGFAEVIDTCRDTLRLEFRRPVPGLAMAVRRD